MPVRSPWRSRIAAVSRAVEVLPFVPRMWIEPKRRSGEPSAVIMRRIFSSPKRMPNSSSERRWRSACASLQRPTPAGAARAEGPPRRGRAVPASFPPRSAFGMDVRRAAYASGCLRR